MSCKQNRELLAQLPLTQFRGTDPLHGIILGFSCGKVKGVVRPCDFSGNPIS